MSVGAINSSTLKVEDLSSLNSPRTRLGIPTSSKITNFLWIFCTWCSPMRWQIPNTRLLCYCECRLAIPQLHSNVAVKITKIDDIQLHAILLWCCCVFWSELGELRNFNSTRAQELKLLVTFSLPTQFSRWIIGNMQVSKKYDINFQWGNSKSNSNHRKQTGCRLQCLSFDRWRNNYFSKEIFTLPPTNFEEVAIK